MSDTPVTEALVRRLTDAAATLQDDGSLKDYLTALSTFVAEAVEALEVLQRRRDALTDSTAVGKALTEVARTAKDADFTASSAVALTEDEVKPRLDALEAALETLQSRFDVLENR